MPGRNRRIKQGLLLTLAIGFVLMSSQPMSGYRLLRLAGRALPALAQADWLALEGEHFTIYFREADGDIAREISENLELVLSQLQDDWPIKIENVPVTIHPDQTSLGKAIGAQAEATLGAYWLGRLELLSPRAWLSAVPSEDMMAVYREQGPLTHELVHLLLDYRVHGNCPLWFSEGLAQRYERDLQGYTWGIMGASWSVPLYSLEQLTSQFTQLEAYPAYRQALGLVDYIWNVAGDRGMVLLLERLSEGDRFAGALEAVTGRTLQELEQGWRAQLQLETAED